MESNKRKMINEKFQLENNFCPIPIEEYPQILLAHGGGGRLMKQLIEKMFLPAFGPASPSLLHDAALLSLNGEIAFTTDSYVVHPLFFPGGDIGSLAVHGTVNDLAMAGAKPLFLSVGFILEEGLPMETLWRVVLSMQRAAERSGVRIVTGDTKVVDRGKGDGIFINTAGIGVKRHSRKIKPGEVRPGDLLLVNGDLGRHGIAIMAAREGLAFDTTIESDSTPLADPVEALLSREIEIHCLRDLTRGGLASALNEIAEAAGVTIRIEEDQIPIQEEVRGACEILGLDPLYVANEGRFVAFVAPSDAERALSILRADPMGTKASLIGRVTDDTAFSVIMKNRIGTDRRVDMLAGNQLPRIC
jgi:hydrogenase expression/formation protein HypE